MVDVVSRKIRSRMMAGIRGKNTKPELLLRSGLHRLGFRFRVHSTKLIGKPDLVFPKLKAVIFVHGCFWHGHDCRYFRMPSTRRQFWQRKILRNRDRHGEVIQVLQQQGWRHLTIWECATRGQDAAQIERVTTRAANWLRSKKKTGIIRG